MTGFERYRRKQLLSRAELAAFMNVSVTSVMKWETGRSTPTPSNLIRLSDLYGVPINDLLRKDWPKNDPPAYTAENKEAITCSPKSS